MADIIYSNTIFVDNLSERVKEEDLTEIFSRYGKVSKMDHKGHFAFIFFEKESDMNDAIKNMHNQLVDGKQIVVEKARGTGTKADFEGRENVRPEGLGSHRERGHINKCFPEKPHR